MTQFFDALERQLVALSMEAPRMTPRARARRRLAVGTVTVLCLFACLAGASVLPRLLRNMPTEQGSLLAGLPAGPPTGAGPGTRDVSTSTWSPALGAADGAIGERGCGGRQAGVGDVGAQGVRDAGAQKAVGRDVDNATGRLQGLVCLIWAGAGSRRQSKRLLGACPSTPSGRGGDTTPFRRGGGVARSGRGGGVDRFADDTQSLRSIEREPCARKPLPRRGAP